MNLFMELIPCYMLSNSKSVTKMRSVSSHRHRLLLLFLSLICHSAWRYIYRLHTAIPGAGKLLRLGQFWEDEHPAKPQSSVPRLFLFFLRFLFLTTSILCLSSLKIFMSYNENTYVPREMNEAWEILEISRGPPPPRVRQNVKWVLFSVCGAQIPATAVAPGESFCSAHDWSTQSICLGGSWVGSWIFQF